MSLWDRIDAESKPALDILWEALPGGLNGIPDIDARRAAYEAFRAAAPKGEFPDLNVSDHSYSGPDGDLSLRLVWSLRLNTRIPPFCFSVSCDGR